jgi:hypothetical protein
MTTFRLLTRFISCAAAIAVAIGCDRPRPVSISLPLRVGMLRQPVKLAGRTLVLLVPDSADRTAPPTQAFRLSATVDSALAMAKRVAEPLGYAVELRFAETARVLDRQGGAIYDPPSAVAVGFIIAAPGLRPRLVAGLIGEQELTRRLKEYGLFLRPLDV